MCAIEAGKRGLRVALLDHADRVGKKILISGGGRCNFTNLHTKPENFLSANPHFAKSALARYTPADFIALIEKHHIAYHEKTLGQLFCDRSAQEVVAMLLAECAEASVQISLKTSIEAVEHRAGFTLRSGDASYFTPRLVIATGGLSIPKMGATDFGYQIARQFDISIRDCRPALVPLVFDDADRRGLCDLSGVSADVVVAIGKRRFREKLLITHRGVSGPAILQISSYWEGVQAVSIDWVPGQEIFASLRAPNAVREMAAAKQVLRGILAARLGDRLLDLVESLRWTNQGLDDLENQLHNWEFVPAGTEGYEKAEVTAGGVDTSELSARTMECRRVPGLFFIGEVVDVTGHLGGFNFQWAWASGAAAGREM
jgi:predicted Rossmann fold flavoprotein